MGRFKSRKSRTSIRAPVETVYLANPVGSNEWHRQKRINMEKRRIDEELRLKFLRENPPKKEQDNSQYKKPYRRRNNRKQ